ncbi:MAG: WYL domain-containing protein [Chloroflexi bacterium]|nr:WYL domain-containing protein [Chloroflexota bacterium]
MGFSRVRGDRSDKMARLIRLEHLLSQNTQGLTIAQLARRCDIGQRTIRRDLKELEHEAGLPLRNEDGRWGVVEGSYLPPIRFTPSEATAIFLAARLVLAYHNIYNPAIDSTFTKLNSVVKPPLRDQVRKTLEWMGKQKRDDHYISVLQTVIQAWTEGRRAKIAYTTPGHNQPVERTIEPYFIQPGLIERANYLIAYCHRARDIRIFKMDRIRSIDLLYERYAIPAEFDANEYLGASLGIVAEGDPVEVKLSFNPEIAHVARETTWHPSQKTDMQPNGSALVTMTVSPTVQLTSFILGWGEKVEVLAPAELRQEVARTAAATSRVYRKKKKR